jgi:hypothetical protein
MEIDTNTSRRLSARSFVKPGVRVC